MRVCGRVLTPRSPVMNHNKVKTEMADTKQPETLADLLRTLERSGELRSLARECGLSVRELRRRLAIWRREINSDDGQGLPLALEGGTATAKVAGKTTSKAGKGDKKAAPWPELIPAVDIRDNPLPGEGSDVLEIFTDGASRGNPGPAAVGVVFRQKGGPQLAEHCEAIGKATNNVAEYQAVVCALEHAVRWRVGRVHLYMDSELIVRQLTGVYRVKSPDLRPLFQQTVFLSKQLREFRVKHVKRAQNAHADHLANKALDG
jgi:ribonuclease HI